MKMSMRRYAFRLLCTVAALMVHAASAFALSGTSVAIQAWVKEPSNESCLTTPYGQIVNGCGGVVEIDLPVYAVHYKQNTNAGVWIRWDGSGSKPGCQIISVTDTSGLDQATPIMYANGTGWEEMTGVVDKSVGGTFIACWLNPGDSLSSYWWEPQS
ncbi:MAG: hypothetical protein IPM35_37330 [Myxococcales bacterium]|nr:hypothetical protein [Myxococcales bacterium]